MASQRRTWALNERRQCGAERGTRGIQDPDEVGGLKKVGGNKGVTLNSPRGRPLCLLPGNLCGYGIVLFVEYSSSDGVWRQIPH